MNIELAGKRGKHQRDRVIMTSGLCPTLVVGSRDNAQWMNLIIVPYYTMNKSKLNRYVRYIYRKLISKFGAQKVREQGLRLFVLTTKERDNARPSNEFINALLDLCIEWNITPKIGLDLSETLWQDLTPIRVRIRKLTPTECLRLMDVRDDDIEKMKNAGISNSGLYKLAGNSIVCACLMGIFTQLFRADSDSLF